MAGRPRPEAGAEVDGAAAVKVGYLRLRDLDCQRLRAAMGDQAFDAEYTTGKSVTTDEVLTLAFSNQAEKVLPHPP